MRAMVSCFVYSEIFILAFNHGRLLSFWNQIKQSKLIIIPRKIDLLKENCESHAHVLKRRKTQEIDVDCEKNVSREQLEAKPAVWNSDQMEMNFSSTE